MTVTAPVERFQSTFPRGERPCRRIIPPKISDFNPRSRVGNDCKMFSPVNFTKISIHVPAWGTTTGNWCAKNVFNISIHVPAGVTTTLFSLTFTAPVISIHVPAWGTTLCCVYCASDGLFQSTFPRGERQQILTIFHLYIRISNPNLHFNITPFHIFYLIHFFWACFFQLFMVRIFWGFSVYFWFALYRNNT